MKEVVLIGSVVLPHLLKAAQLTLVYAGGDKIKFWMGVGSAIGSLILLPLIALFWRPWAREDERFTDLIN